MDTTTAVVCLVAIVALAVLIAFAIHRKPYVRAGGRSRYGEFYIEAADQRMMAPSVGHEATQAIARSRD